MVVLNGRSALLPDGLPVYRDQHAVAGLDEFLRANRQVLEVLELQAHPSRDFRPDVTPRLRALRVHNADGVCVEQLASSPEVPAPPLVVDGPEGIPLSPGMAIALDRLRQASAYTEAGDPVFPSRIGTPMEYSALRRRVLRPAIEASGIDWPKGTAFHMFRKTAASLIHDSGKSGRQLADWLGHHDPAFTIRTYVGQVDSGLGDPTFLDELVPADGGQPGGNPTPADSRKRMDETEEESSANGKIRQTAATYKPFS
jgi:Phage integrase family